ncbi:MAG: hypothetical protein DRR19_12900 [Candidatus Parabeggiatoa sp. nov. 1]|nr:MAG: hypothetical protein DRR19_12900 [Gammaproteobacteria bacterium]
MQDRYTVSPQENRGNHKAFARIEGVVQESKIFEEPAKLKFGLLFTPKNKFDRVLGLFTFNPLTGWNVSYSQAIEMHTPDSITHIAPLPFF